MYKEYNDYELLDFVAENNEDAVNIMHKKYEPIVISMAKEYFSSNTNLGLEINDLIQEGRVGLNNAINTYSDAKETLFFTYALTCIEKKMQSAIVAAKRNKNRILNESVSIEKMTTEIQVDYLKALSDGNVFNPENLVINRLEQKELIEEIKNNLTDLEKEVFDLKICGFDYKEIALKLHKEPKQIDNALQRIKNKINILIENRIEKEV